MDIEKYCEMFYSLHYIPISIIENNKIVKTFSALGNHISFNEKPFMNIVKTDKELDIISLLDLGQYGIIKVKSTNKSILLGPTYTTAITDNIVFSFIKNNVIPNVENDGISALLNSIPKYTYNQFFSLVGFLFSSINGETVDILEKFFSDKTTDIIAAHHTNNTYIAKEEEKSHGTFNFENILLSYVGKGEVDKLKSFLFEENKKQKFQEGRLADTPLRQSKNLFIGFTTMVGKVGAINGGMDVEDAYRLIDIYIQECEKAQSVDSVKILQFNMLLDFADRVAQCRMPKGITKDIFTCVQYIQNHTNQIVSINDLVKLTNISRASITKKFRAETGISIGNYITQCKINDAKRLLTYSDKSLAEISNHLCYSSQAYFQTVFKKEIGVTPNEYRKRYHIETEREKK